MASSEKITGKFLDYTDGEVTFEAYVVEAAAAASERLPCVILAHDWSGLNEGMRRMAERVADLGYLVFAADVYGKGIRGSERGDNSHLIAPLMADRELVRRRMLLAMEALATLPRADATRVVAMGYCLGGLCALDLARAAPPNLKGALSVHGTLTAPGLGPQPTITARVLLLHGWDDPLVPQADLLAITRELTEAGADWELRGYGHALHAFTFEGAHMPERGIAYQAAAAHRSWEATCAFLAETLADTSINIGRSGT